MKIKSLQIDAYRHLQNLHLDFTYPAGHDKAGQPLDKICIIGQSATGKTSLLELVRDSFTQLDDIEVINGHYIFKHFRLTFDGQLEFWKNGGALKIKAKKDSIFFNEQEFGNTSGNIGGFVEKLLSDDLKLLYLTTGLISKKLIDILNQNPLNILNELSKEQYAEFQKKYNRSSYIYEFNQNSNEEVWFALLYDTLDYRKRFTQMASELINKGAIGDLAKLNREYATWATENKNPLESFAKIFNPAIEKMYLEVDLINTEFLFPIKSHSKDEVIPTQSLSTGTKGLLLSMFPLYTLDTNDAIILLDEPETSLYPDIQLDIIKNYQSLAPGAQFIVATHSPLIASGFDPWEIVELKFNSEGNVYRELYYEGENHVDNYKYNPRYMRWDDILQRIFDMENDGSSLRKQKLDKLATCNVKYKKLQKEDKAETEDGKKILQEIQKLSKELSMWK